MKATRIILTSVLLSTIIAILISYLPVDVLSVASNKNEITVFQWRFSRPITLTENNIVDWINNQSVEHPISFVEWRNQSLSIDLSVDKDETLEPIELYMDIYTLIQSTFLQTENVEFLLLRVYGVDDEQKEMIIYMLASRQLALHSAQKLDGIESTNVENYLTKTFNLQHLPKWAKWIER